ncbi:methylosome subunit pICln isoform X2 [Planococcus citri]|uniref:methylosome subunit pICln isoform X2 n=1 Tax=Planococcus citri TaxID=170843 RepID=UPI0031F778A0
MIAMVALEPPQEGIRLKEEHTLAYVNDVNKGLGVLYITENNIVWINECNSEGFTLNYPDISIFAVCTDQEKYSESCVYMLVDDESSSADDDSESNGDDDESKEMEIRFAPLEGTNVRDLFDCIQACNQLHPGPNDLNDSDNTTDDDNFDANDDDDESTGYTNGADDSGNLNQDKYE